MVTTTTASDVLRSYYLNAVAEQLNKTANPLLAAIEQTTTDVTGKDVRKAVVYGMHGGVGARSESGDLPKSDTDRYAQLVSSLKNLYGKIEISDKAIRASQNNDGAFVNLLNEEMVSLVRSSSFNLGRMLFGDGSGKLAKITALSGNVYTVDSVQNFAVGMIVDVYNSSDSLLGSGRTVTSVDYEAGTIVLGGAVYSDSVGGALYAHAARGFELTGLGAIFSTSNSLYGLSRTQNEWLKPVIIEDVGTLTESALQKAIDRVDAAAGSRINFIVCSWGVRRALFDVLSDYRTTQTADLSGGVRTISFNGIPVVADRFCPKGTMYLLNTEDFRLHQLCDWQWLEGENGNILHQEPNKAGYTATLVKYAELMCYRPCGQAVLRGITES